MKETKAKIKSLASKLFKSVQTKAAASDFLSLHVASGGGGAHPLTEQEGTQAMPHSLATSSLSDRLRGCLWLYSTRNHPSPLRSHVRAAV